MNQTKILAFALSAMLACVSFASCGDDDKNDDPKPVEQDNPNAPDIPAPSVAKRLVSISISDNRRTSLSYDSEGRISEVVTRGGSYELERIRYTYSSSKITAVTSTSGNYRTDTYLIANGLITRRQCVSTYSENETSYTYNNGYISQWRDDYGSNDTFFWSAGDVSKTTTVMNGSGLDIFSRTYTYSSNYDYGGASCFVFDCSGIFDVDPYLAMQGFFGVRPMHMPKSAYEKEDDGDIYQYSWSYELDGDGYPISMTQTDDYDNISYSFIWETL